MFLITTPENKSWSNVGKILFLGEWCKLFQARDRWSTLDYKTVPYHWDDRKKFMSDNIKIESLYEKYLSILADQLNKIHNENYSIRYWRIVIGLWLRYFIEIAFDRYESINSAKDCYKIDETWILKYSLSDWVSLDYEKFHKFNF